MENLILIAILAIIIIASAVYIYKAKKNGQACVGCPYSKECSNGRCNCSDKQSK